MTKLLPFTFVLLLAPLGCSGGEFAIADPMATPDAADETSTSFVLDTGAAAETSSDETSVAPPDAGPDTTPPPADTGEPDTSSPAPDTTPTGGDSGAADTYVPPPDTAPIDTGVVDSGSVVDTAPIDTGVVDTGSGTGHACQYCLRQTTNCPSATADYECYVNCGAQSTCYFISGSCACG